MSLPRLLLGVGGEPMSYPEHVALHGHRPSGAGRSGVGPSPLTGELARAGLRGRGGGAFPLAAKLDAVAHARGRPVVLVNATEGEPMSVKDRMLLECLPHLVLDGALCVAEALRAADVVIALSASFSTAAESLRAALRSRPDVGRRTPQPRVVAVPPGYVSGQETAIVNFVDHGIPRPTTQPPRVSERGIGRRPTLVSNAETLAHAALIARHGAKWFRQLGPEDEPGSFLVTLSGGVGAPGVYEVAYGSSLSSLVGAADGATEPVRAVLFGGYAGGWVDGADARALPLTSAALRPLRASLGAGIIVVLPQSACPAAEVARVAGYLSAQSAGQCGPCVNGLASIADTMADLCRGRARRDAFGDLRRWSELVVGRGACAHPDGAARFIASALSVFVAELEDHARHGPCEACARRPVLITPRPRAAGARVQRQMER